MESKNLFLYIFIALLLSCNPKNEIRLDNLNSKLNDLPPISGSADNSVRDSLKKANVNYLVKQLDNSNGLSNSSVNAIFQDSENLMWIGTWDGLNRYDGNKFKIYRPELNKENSLSNQVILKIGEDEKGAIWVLTMNGINKFDKKENIFQRYYFSQKNKPTLSESEFNIAFDSSKKVFCAVKNWGLGYFDGNEFQQMTVENLPREAVKKMEFISSGELLILYENNKLFSLLIHTKKGKKTISKYELISENTQTFGLVSNTKICTVSITGDTNIYSLLDKKNKMISKNNIQSVVGYTSEGLVLSSKSNYFIIDSLGVLKESPWIDHIKNKKIKTLIQGNENIIWSGTDGDGLFKIYPRKKSFNLISTAQVPEFDDGIVRAFIEDDKNSFWVGTKGKGLFRFPHNFYFNNSGSLEYENFNESNSSINNAVFALSKGQNNLIFIGTDGDGITIYDLKESKLVSWTEIIGSKQSEYFKSVYTIYQDNKGFIWLGTNGYGMIRFKIERSNKRLKVTQFKKFLANNEEGKSLSSNIIFSIIPKNDHELWIGTRLGGLNLFNKSTELFKSYKNRENDSKSLSSNDILSLHSDKNNNLWIGTSFGLNLLKEIKNNSDEVEFESLTNRDGLPNNTIHGIVSDNQSNLWISTNFGLSNYIIDATKFINYTKSEGLQNNEFADGAFYKNLKTDFIFMGGIKGFNYFLPSKIVESTAIPNILIDQISGQNQKIPYYQGLVVSPYSKTFPSIVLKHNQNFFDIELAALTYINSEKCQYSYKLSNFDQDWITINNRRTISFTNVPQGKYSLWIKWSNSDGVWSNSVHAIDIQVKPIFWQSNVAMMLYSLLSILFLLFVFSYYKKRQSLKQNILFRKRDEEVHQNRLTFFTNIAHEFQTPLTLIIGPIQKLSETTNFNEKNQKFIGMIQRNSSRLLFLTQQLLEFRKAEYDYLEIEAKQFDLVNLVEQIAELFDELALDKNIDYSLNLPSELYGWFDKDKIEKIVFNLLSNAFKYTPNKGEIKLHFFIQSGDIKTLNINVSNTGKGITKEKIDSLFDRFFLADKEKKSDSSILRTGIGLAYTKRLVTVLRGEILVSSTPNKITTFKVKIPCSKDVFSEIELDNEVSPILISHHLKNIIEDVPSKIKGAVNKATSLDAILNKRKVVLVVDDENEIQLFLNELLREKYKVISANNGIEAMQIIKHEIPDVIISDIMMPLMDGIEFCEKIKKDINTCHIPFIMLTAKSSVIQQIEGLESGANSYIPKPFHPNHVLIKVQKLIEEKELILKHLNKDSFFESLTSLPVDNDEKEFIKKSIELIRNNIENENLQSLFIEKNLGISSSQLYRKIKKTFSLSPGDLIRTIRLKHAAELLRKSTLTVSEVCYQSGFNNRSYFYREFKKMYHITPKDYHLKNK